MAGIFRLVLLDRENGSKYESHIQNQIDAALATARSEHEIIASRIPQATRFEHYETPATFPYFIFSGDSLLYWSSHKYIPKGGLKGINELFVEYNKNYGLLVSSEAENHRYEIISLIPLYRSGSQGGGGLNYSIFHAIPGTISATETPGSITVHSSSGKPLFYVKPTGTPSTPVLHASRVTLWLFSIGFIFLGLLAVLHVISLEKKHHFLLASFYLILLMTVARLILWILGLPWELLPEWLFPEYVLALPGFKDRILTAYAVRLVLACMALWQVKALTAAGMRKYSAYWKSLISVMLVVASITLGYAVYDQILQVFEHPAVGSEYSFKFAHYQWGAYFYIYCLFGIYFLGNHLLINTFKSLRSDLRYGFSHWLYGVLLAAMLFYYNGLNLWVWLISSLYFLAAFGLKLPRYFYILRFKTFVYFLTAIFAFTLTLFTLTTRHNYTKNLHLKVGVAQKLLQQKDLKAELLLDQFHSLVRNDTVLANTLQRPVLAHESLQYQVKDSLLSPYFHSYEVDVQAYTTGGKPIGNNSLPPLSRVYAQYAGAENRTEFPGLYFPGVEDGKNTYVLFSEVVKNNIRRGVLMVKVRYSTDQLVQSAEKQSVQTIRTDPATALFSYALLDKNQKIIYTEGAFDYLRAFDYALPASADVSGRQVRTPGYLHYLRKDASGNTAVVTQPSDFYRDTLSTFSYLFLITLTATLGLFFLLAVLSGFKLYRISFSSKIQFFLNLAFLVPLTIIILLTLGVVISSFNTLQNRAIRENSRNVTNTIKLHYQDYFQGNSTRAYLEEQLSNLALSGNFDLSIFDQQGNLTYTSTPTLYRTGQLADRINPEAYTRLASGQADDLLVEENRDDTAIKTIYLNGKLGDNRSFGMISISYPDADFSLQSQIREVGAAILIIFLVMFIILLAFSYAASSSLTSPLKLIAHTLKKTNLEAKNEEISWRSNDEIGLLTSEYNRMIKKLEESRIALSTSEKQTAWREMARQVAHEIKNPLTPMKLSIQQLQRTLPADNEETREKINRTLASINEQIDNISEIANSFSEFAKMPVPQSEVFDLVSSVRKALDLYSQNNTIKINFLSEQPEIKVVGDKMILSRAVNNLVLNGLQSVPANRKPIITVIVSEKGDMGLVEVQDNGSGISEELRKKVFIPNFSTKTGGSGLGLSMAKRGIEHAGGNLWFDSVEGTGTTFYLELPKNK